MSNMRYLLLFAIVNFKFCSFFQRKMNKFSIQWIWWFYFLNKSCNRNEQCKKLPNRMENKQLVHGTKHKLNWVFQKFKQQRILVFIGLDIAPCQISISRIFFQFIFFVVLQFDEWINVVLPTSKSKKNIKKWKLYALFRPNIFLECNVISWRKIKSQQNV